MALTGTDLFIVGRGITNYRITGTQLADFVVLNGLPSQAGNAGKFLTTNGTTLSWAAVGGGGGAVAATLAEAATGTLNTVYSSPQTAVPKDATGMAGAAILPGSAAAYAGSPTTGMIRYNNSAPPAVIEYYNGSAWVALSTGGGGGATAASLAQAAAGILNTVYSSPETAVPKDASGMAGAAILPGSASAYGGTSATGMLRYNNSAPPAYLEYYNGSAWVPLATVSATQTFGLGLNVTGTLVKASVPIAATPPTAGSGSAQAIGGSLYWDDNLTQLFIRYPNTGGPGPVWVAAAPSAGGGSSVSAASLAEAAAATITNKYLSPGTGIARNAAGTTGAALLPAGTTAQRAAIATPVTGMTRYNSTIGTLEVYNGTTWIALTTAGGNFDPSGWFGHSASPS